MAFSTQRSVGFILLAGIVIFAGVFLGIRTASLFGSDHSQLTPADLSNQSSLKIGDSVPALPIVSLDGAKAILGELSRDQAAVIAFVMPGCGPCGNLMADWSASDFGKNSSWKPIIVAVGSQEQARNALPNIISGQFQVYTCNENDLDKNAGVTVYPTIVGLGIGGKVCFVASGYTRQIGADFLDKYVH